MNEGIVAECRTARADRCITCCEEKPAARAWKNQDARWKEREEEGCGRWHQLNQTGLQLEERVAVGDGFKGGNEGSFLDEPEQDASSSKVFTWNYFQTAASVCGESFCDSEGDLPYVSSHSSIA